MGSKGTGRAPRVSEQMTADILRILRERGEGAEHAITAGDLCLALGMTPTESAKRVVRAVISAMPEAGFLVVGDDHGYLIPAEACEADASLGRMAKQIETTTRRMDAVKRLIGRKFHKPVLGAAPPPVTSWRARRPDPEPDAQPHLV